MIRDIVEAAKGKKGADIPPRLVYAWRCKEYRALPQAGGLGGQDYRQIYLNDVLPRIYEAVQHWRVKGGFDMSASDKSIIGWLSKTGMM